MARYEDYVKDDIQDEIEDASANAQVRAETQETGFTLPKEFEGKSTEEVAKSYVELQKLYSRQANDLGQMRKTVDELVRLQSQVNEPPGKSDDEPVSIDDLYSDAEATIKRVAEKTAGRRIEALEAKVREKEVNERLREFSTKYPDWQTTAQSPEFLNWISESSYRKRLAAAADSYDFDAAEDLFGMYIDQKGHARKQEDQQKRRRQLRDASLESSSPAHPESVETFSRQNLLNARVAAKQGNANARAWLAANADAIASAYEEGRITD